MLWTPPGGLFGFGFVVGNYLASRPANALGTSITAAQNAYTGGYTQVLSALAQDCYGLLVGFNSGGVAGQAKDTIATIGVDPAGGTSYTDTINHLLCSGSPASATGIPWYYFPIWLKAGSTVACKASVNNATPGTVRCMVQAYGQPTDSRLVKCGTFVETIGANTAASAGTAVTAGTTSDGTWTSLGTTTRDTWWFQHGMGLNSNNFGGILYASDLANSNDATNFDFLQRKQIIWTNSSEQIWWNLHFGMNARRIPGGSGIYGRLQSAGVAESNLSMIAYALGG